MTGRNRIMKTLSIALVAGCMCWLAAGTAVAEDPVTVTVTVTGDAQPGATVTAAAEVVINDGSTLVSMEWMQEGGVAATLAGTQTDTVTATLGSRDDYRAYLGHILAEPPIAGDQLPPNVPLPPGEFVGGIPNRFALAGSSPFALEHTAAVELVLEVVTTSGTYHKVVEIATALPWTPESGIRNVPVQVPLVLYGKEQATYDWALKVPTGSSATLMGATTRTPEFTPDIPGNYQVTVTDTTQNTVISISIVAGAWRGVIVGQDADGRPVPDANCTGCHNGSYAPDVFTPWAQTGHAEIFTDNLNTSTHYGEGCLSCHTVGYDTNAFNHGIDDQPDWQAFLDSGMLHHADLSNWTTMLEVYPASAKLANIQCENCHGPQSSNAHMQGTGSRISLSSDVCGICHGEPARHGRFQQWQLSGHANYELATDEGENGNCSRCHTGNGFLAWEDLNFDAGSNVEVTWTSDQIHPQTCQTCHDPHDIGTTSGNAETNATVRISGDTPMLAAGFVATDVGRGAICMTCHNGRRGLRNDSNFDIADAARAPHVGPQADVLMGQNAYFVEVGKRSYHSQIEDACVTCHMEATPPPDLLSYNLGGTNHTFYARKDICANCHTFANYEGVQGPVQNKLAKLKGEIEDALYAVIDAQTNQGAVIDFGGEATIGSASEILGLDFEESHGRQGLAVQLASGWVGPVAMNSVKVVPAVGAATDIYRVADPSVAKAGWNYWLVHSDASLGVHNPGFVNSALDVSLFAVANADVPGEGGDNGNVGQGQGAVSCTTPFVYWTEIATHGTGKGGVPWRTDLVAHNMSTDEATVEFILHTDGGEVNAAWMVPGASQGVFEDVVGLLGANTKGALEICSDQPLEILSRIFATGDDGTYGQFVDGRGGISGMSAGQSARLLGLRQKTGEFRTNISVTNAGTEDAEVAVTLFDSSGNELHTYTMDVAAGMVVQDLEPFKTRAGQPDLGWGFATVKVLSGFNVITSGSVVDNNSDDPTTIPMKR